MSVPSKLIHQNFISSHHPPSLHLNILFSFLLPFILSDLKMKGRHNLAAREQHYMCVSESLFVSRMSTVSQMKEERNLLGPDQLCDSIKNTDNLDSEFKLKIDSGIWTFSWDSDRLTHAVCGSLGEPHLNVLFFAALSLMNFFKFSLFTVN